MYWLVPSEDEWYKAAYYQPAAKGGDSDGYWAYPTRTNSLPSVATLVADDASVADALRHVLVGRQDHDPLHVGVFRPAGRRGGSLARGEGSMARVAEERGIEVEGAGSAGEEDARAGDVARLSHYADN